MYCENNRYKILTPNGYEDFYGIQKITKDISYIVKFNDNTTIECSEDHVFISGIEEFKISDLIVGDVISSIEGFKIVSEIDIKNVEVDLYDIIESGIDHVYYANDILNHNCKFLGSAGTLLPTQILETLRRIKPIVEEKIDETNVSLAVFKQPSEGRSYLVTHDASEGLGEPNTGSQADENGNNDPDYTGIHVWDITNLNNIEQVARVYDRTIVEDDAPYIIKRICQKYNNAFEISENNMLPSIPKTVFRDLDYENVYRHTDGRYGIKMTQSSRNKGLGIMKMFFREGRIKIHDEDTIFELSNFVNKNGKYQAADGKHDDLVTSMNLLCWFLADKERYKKYINEDGNFMKDIHKRNVDDEEFCMFVDDGIGDAEDWSSGISYEFNDKYLPPSD